MKKLWGKRKGNVHFLDFFLERAEKLPVNLEISNKEEKLKGPINNG